MTQKQNKRMYERAAEEEWALRMLGVLNAADRLRQAALRKLIAKLEAELPENDEPGGRLHRAER